MRFSERVPLIFSLAVISAYGAYKIFSLNLHPEIPAQFRDLVFQIVKLKLLVFIVIIALLRFQKQGFDSLGLSNNQLRNQIVRGLGLGAVMFMLINVVLNTLLTSIFSNGSSSGSGILVFFKDPYNLFAWLLIGTLGGGLVEEMERIFVITRFEQWLGKWGVAAGVGLSSLLFGAGHLYQGIGTAISTTVSGLCFAWIYLKRRQGWEPVVAHAFSDVLAIIAATLLAK